MPFIRVSFGRNIKFRQGFHLELGGLVEEAVYAVDALTLDKGDVTVLCGKDLHVVGHPNEVIVHVSGLLAIRGRTTAVVEALIKRLQAKVGEFLLKEGCGAEILKVLVDPLAPEAYFSQTKISTPA